MCWKNSTYRLRVYYNTQCYIYTRIVRKILLSRQFCHTCSFRFRPRAVSGYVRNIVDNLTEKKTTMISPYTKRIYRSFGFTILYFSYCIYISFWNSGWGCRLSTMHSKYKCCVIRTKRVWNAYRRSGGIRAIKSIKFEMLWFPPISVKARCVRTSYRYIFYTDRNLIAL